MSKHRFWGVVELGWAGFSGEKTYTIPHFAKSDVEIFFGDEFDEEGEELEDAPSSDKLDQYEETFLAFLEHLDTIIIEIKQKTFERYQKIYAHYYEDKSKSGKDPLYINTSEKHFKCVQDINYIRISDDHVLRISIRYEIDTEHGIEIKIQDNKVIDIGGIAET
ncbi:DUF6985 domain-containing protein [Pedobacter cryoconitis]|uniref:DUF6985 domain-containing protein n=1 Tax=Pedobacter cryoconitis TaxID=188932 RepID=A0A7X0J0H3_9SPHI|nr:hypothetical protein [Pedobacter cryoconitis]MBB6498217.1 hypothetical protein [Pedobacter cryoconitis]